MQKSFLPLMGMLIAFESAQSVGVSNIRSFSMDSLTGPLPTLSQRLGTLKTRTVRSCTFKVRGGTHCAVSTTCG